MQPVRKSLAVALLAGGSIVGGFAGTTLVRSGANSAVAQEAPKPTAPDQGTVAGKAQVSDADLQHVETLATVFRKVGKTIEPSVVKIDVIKAADRVHKAVSEPAGAASVRVSENRCWEKRKPGGTKISR